MYVGKLLQDLDGCRCRWSAITDRVDELATRSTERVIVADGVCKNIGVEN
jgi:hypothetical protein